MGVLIVMRHGETEWTRTRRHTSLTDVPLTDHGRDQARALAPLLAGRPLGKVLVSPLRRAVATARLAGLTHLTEEPDLLEWDYGGYEGVTTAEIHRTRPGWNLWADGAPPGPDGQRGESPAQVARRADRLLARLEPLLEDREAPDVVLVGHGHFLRALTARRLGLPLAVGSLFVLDTGRLGHLGFEHGQPALVGWNVGPVVELGGHTVEGIRATSGS